MSTKQAGSLYTLKYGYCWRMLAEGKTETKIKNIKALCKLCTLKFLTLRVYIKCHNFLKPQNRRRVKKMLTLIGYNKSFGFLIISNLVCFPVSAQLHKGNFVSQIQISQLEVSGRGFNSKTTRGRAHMRGFLQC